MAAKKTTSSATNSRTDPPTNSQDTLTIAMQVHTLAQMLIHQMQVPAANPGFQAQAAPGGNSQELPYGTWYAQTQMQQLPTTLAAPTMQAGGPTVIYWYP